jgi:hypothetical protein
VIRVTRARILAPRDENDNRRCPTCRAHVARKVADAILAGEPGRCACGTLLVTFDAPQDIER